MFDEFEKEDDQWRPEGSRVVKIIKTSVGAMTKEQMEKTFVQ
jgi:hypothetical protein